MIGELRIEKGILKDRYFVLVDERKNYRREVEFRSFEHAMILKEILRFVSPEESAP